MENAISCYKLMESEYEAVEGFYYKALSEKVDNLCDYLEAKDVKPVMHKKVQYYVFKDVVFAVRSLSRNGKLRGFALMDTSVYKKYLEDGKGNLLFVKRGKGDYKVRIERPGECIVLHHTLEGYTDGTTVDHRYRNPLINTSDALRICEDEDNRHNTKFYHWSAKTGLPDEAAKALAQGCTESKVYECIVSYEKDKFGDFAYNPLQDFTNTWHAYVLYRTLNIGTWRDLEVYNWDYIERFDKDTKRYYESMRIV